MNDLPVTDIPPNVAHLIRSDDGIQPPTDTVKLSSSDFAFDIVPFAPLFHGWLKKSQSKDPSFGLTFTDDSVRHRPFLSDIAKKSPGSKLCSSYQATRNKLLGAYVLEINHNRVFTAADASNLLQELHNQGVEDDIPITFALKAKLKASQVRKQVNENSLFAPNTKWDENENINEDPKFMDRPSNQTAHLQTLHARI